MADVEIQLSRTPGDQSDLKQVHETLWSALLGHLESYRGPIQEALAELAPPMKAQMSGDGATLIYTVPDDHPRAEALEAGLRVVLACFLEELSSDVSSLGWWIEAPRRDLSDVFSEQEEALGDESSLAHMIGPNARFLEHLIRLLDAHQPQSGDLAHLNTVAWYLRHTARPPAEAVEEVLETCERTPGRNAARLGLSLVRAVVERTDLHALLRSRLVSEHATARGVALGGLAWLIQQKRVTPQAGVTHILQGLALGGFAAEVAAEEALNVVPKEDSAARRRVYNALVTLLEDEPEEPVRHAGLLALVNMMLHRSTIPEGFVSVLNQHVDAPGTMAGLAQWAIQVFSERPEAPWDDAG
ncbi:MAG: hypothetical protein AAFX99_06100 [Myxococcota bacterium]